MAIVSGLVATALWLWMAQATGQGKNWARILSTVLFGLATLQMIGQASVQPGESWSHVGVGLLVLFVIVPVLGWLVGLAAPVTMADGPTVVTITFNPSGTIARLHCGRPPT